MRTGTSSKRRSETAAAAAEEQTSNAGMTARDMAYKAKNDHERKLENAGLLDAFKALEEAGVNAHYIKENLDTSTLYGTFQGVGFDYEAKAGVFVVSEYHGEDRYTFHEFKTAQEAVVKMKEIRRSREQ